MCLLLPCALANLLVLHRECKLANSSKGLKLSSLPVSPEISTPPFPPSPATHLTTTPHPNPLAPSPTLPAPPSPTLPSTTTTTTTTTTPPPPWPPPSPPPPSTTNYHTTSTSLRRPTARHATLDPFRAALATGVLLLRVPLFCWL